MKAYTKNGLELALEKADMPEGAEGAVYEIDGRPEVLVKIYSSDPDLHQKKVEAMTTIASQFVSDGPLSRVAWPLCAVYTDMGCTRFSGFVMKKMDVCCGIGSLYSHTPGAQTGLSIRDKLDVLISLCELFEAFEDNGYTIGDSNDNNILVQPDGQAVFVDADSFHVEINGELFKCPVCMPGYASPDVVRNMRGFKSYEECTKRTFSVYSDRWALAVHCFRMLVNGAHPYKLVHDFKSLGSSIAPTSIDKIIERGDTPFFRIVAQSSIPLWAPTADMLPDYLHNLFFRAFVTGHSVIEDRPCPREWIDALIRYRRDIIQCLHNPDHWYWGAFGSQCPYCAADERALAADAGIELQQAPLIPIASIPQKHANTIRLAARTKAAQTHQQIMSQENAHSEERSIFAAARVLLKKHAAEIAGIAAAAFLLIVIGLGAAATV